MHTVSLSGCSKHNNDGRYVLFTTNWAIIDAVWFVKKISDEDREVAVMSTHILADDTATSLGG